MNPGPHIVVIGTSAGGVVALPTLLATLPADFPAAILIVVHIPIQPDDLLPALLQRKTALVVRAAVDGQPILPGHVYIAPPDNHLVIEPDRIHISHGPRENRHRPAIDPLFRSAAKHYGPRAIGILLTGHLDDGVIGLNAIKTHGGTVLVQSPDEAMAPELVRNAVKNVQVDFVLPLAEIGPRLRELVGSPVPQLRNQPSDGLVDPPLGLENMLGRWGPSEPYSCPECHGPLWENKEASPAEYRCHVGHAYSAESLLIDQELDLEKALWTAVRTFEEQANLLRRLAKKDVTEPLLAKWKRRADQNQKNAEMIRALLQSRR